MRAFIDTNLFVYASYPQFHEHEKALQFLKGCLQGKDLWYISWGVIYEYLRVVTHPALFTGERISLSAALENVKKFCQGSNVEVLVETADHLDQLEGIVLQKGGWQGNLLHDVHTIVLMKEHDIRKIYTADTDFHRFAEVEVVNPIKAGSSMPS